MMVDLKEVKNRVKAIKDLAMDDEAAHSGEDQLHQVVLLSIANGCSNPSSLARAALKTLEIDFTRWCA